MRVFFGVVLCILADSRRIAIASSISTSAWSTTNEDSYSDSSTSSSIFYTLPINENRQSDENCIELDPPLNISITEGKTSAKTTWTTSQTNSTCIPTKLFITCYAENINGWDWVIQNAKVEEDLYGEVNISVNIQNLSEFTNYTCDATLTADNVSSLPTTITFQTKEEVPSEPLNLTISEVTTTSFYVTWQKPEKNPGVFKYYHVDVLSHGARYFVPNSCVQNYTNISKTTADEGYKFSGSPYYEYEIIVFAENSAGNGSSVYSHTVTLPSASEEPREITIEELTIDEELNSITINLTWKMPCESNGPIQLFDITLDGQYTLDPYTKDNRNFSHIANDSEEYFSIVECMPASDYVVSIRADGDTVTGKYSMQQFKTSDNVPGAPIIHDVTDRGPNYLNISWTEPERNSGNITKYEVEIVSLGPLYDYDPDRCPSNDDPVYATVDGGTTTYNFKAGRPYYNYSISVTAFTSRGPGNSSTIFAATNSSVSEKPDNFEFKLKEDNVTGLLSWTVPCNTNGIIQNFTINITGSYTDNSSIVTKNTTYEKYIDGSYNYTHEVQLLEAYNYEANLWIVLEGSIYGEAATRNLTTPDGYPGEPYIINITGINETSFTIIWDPPTTRAGKIENYEVNITSLGPRYHTSCNATPTGNVDYNSSDIREYRFASGKPYFNYSVSIRARTSKGLGNATETFVTTSQGIPESVELSGEPEISEPGEEYNVYANISFKEPCYLNGPFQYFELEMVGKRNDYVDDVHYGKSQFPYFVGSLRPEFVYTYTIITHNEMYSSRSNTGTFVAPAGVPTIFITPTDLKIEKGTSSATITLTKAALDETNGNIQYLAIILSDRNITGGYYDTWDGEHWPSVKSDETKVYYQITSEWWRPFQDADNVTINISQVECEDSDEYCDKPLESNKEYYLIIRVFTQNFYRNSPTIYFKTDDVTKLGVILGTIFGLLVFAVIGIAGFFVWRKNMMTLPQLLNPRKSSNKPPTNSTSIPITKFEQYCKNLENNPDKLVEQYATLAEKTKEAVRMQSTLYSELTENKRKNRYTNILPYDETRVKLLIDEDDEIGSDYINASYIKGFSGEIEYIATQGPLPTTCRDFWKMVIQENVTIIVMVTQFIELNKEKCYKYFPNNRESMTLGDDMEVKCIMELHFGTYCVRHLQVKKDTTQVAVTHMQYLDWPDFNVPKDTETMLHFCYQLRDRLNIEKGCVIVHCSAGVGRTGTLIATDILLQNVKAGRNIDVFNTVLDLRKQRTNMVQTQKQYMYIHSLIKDSLAQRQPPGLNEHLDHHYENVSVLKMKQDDDNLLTSEKETESRF